MKKWEYIVIPEWKVYSDAETQEFLNRKGQEGWELASIAIDASLVHHVFKREIPEPTTPNQTDELEEVRRLLNASDPPQERMDKIRKLLGLKVPEAQPTSKTAQGLDSPPGNE